MIIGPRGENIYPEELESKLNEQEIILESLVYEWENKICARVFLNYEIIDKNYGIGKMGSISAEKKKEKLLDEIRKLVNSQVSSFSVIHKLTEQKEPLKKHLPRKSKGSCIKTEYQLFEKEV